MAIGLAATDYEPDPAWFHETHPGLPGLQSW
jgi:hypothetical protein